jgi:hypothetical protein
MYTYSTYTCQPGNDRFETEADDRLEHKPESAIRLLNSDPQFATAVTVKLTESTMLSTSSWLAVAPCTLM